MYREEPGQIVDGICCWYDLLGYGTPFVNAKWDMWDEAARQSIDRINKVAHIKAIYNPMRAIPKRLEKAFRNWKNSFALCRLKTTMRCSPCVATYAASTNGWHLWMDCNMGHT